MYVSIKPSTTSGKKMMTIFYQETKKKVRTTHFGVSGYEDYSGEHQDLQRKMNYLGRHEKKGNWNDYMSAGSLSKHILWNKPTLTASIEDYMRRFKLKKY
jgi:hypothetical protein